MEEAAKKRNVEVDVLRGIGILLVALGHLAWVLRPETCQQSLAFKIAYTIHMQLLFLVSGFLTGRTDDEKIDFSWLKKRTFRLLVPYTVWTVIASVISGKAGQIAAFLFLSPVYWFLPCLWIYNLVWFLSRRPKSKALRLFVLLFFFALSFLYVVAARGHDVFLKWYLFRFYWYFYLGIYLYRNAGKLNEFLQKRLCDVLLALCLVLYIAGLNFVSLGFEDAFCDSICQRLGIDGGIFRLAVRAMIYVYNYHLINFFGIAGIFFIVHKTAAFCERRQLGVPLLFKFLSVCGIYSIEIYFVHSLLIKSYFGNYYLDFALGLAASVSVSVALGFFSKKFPPLRRILFG